MKEEIKLYNELPKDYKPYQSPIKLMSSETLCCPASLKVDLYLGCTFSCLYCFAMDWFLYRNKQWFRPAKPADISIVEKEFADAFNYKSKSKLAESLRHRQYIRLGSMTDSFQPAELKHRLTQKFFEIANSYDKYPVLIFTKSIIQAEDDYIKLMKDGNYVCQESVSIYDDKLRKKIEPGTYSTEKRFEALNKLSKNDIPVQVRISPHMYPITDISDTFEIIKMAQEVGCNEIIWEPIRITTTSNRIFKQESGIDLIENMRTYGEVESDYGGGSYRNIFPIRQEVMQEIKNEVEDRDMKFYHCLAEDPFNATVPGSDCCGMDNYPEFSKGAVKRNIQQIGVRLKDKGELSHEDIEDLWSCDEDESLKQWNKDYVARYLANTISCDGKCTYCKDAYLNEKDRFRKKESVDEWL